MSCILVSIFNSYSLIHLMVIISDKNKWLWVAEVEIYLCIINNGHWINDGVYVIVIFFMMPTLLFSNHFIMSVHICVKMGPVMVYYGL